MDREELRERIQSFPRWHYQFDLQGILTPIFNPAYHNRHLQRKAYFFDPLVRLCGGSLKGKRVLDLGCNAGFWSLMAVEAGCDYVLGIDGRQMHIDQANLVFQAKGIERDRYGFRRSDIYELQSSDLGDFDIVLCLGLLYHVSKHINLLELIDSVNSDILVIDSSINARHDAVLEIRHEDIEEPRNAIDYNLVMVPSRAALLEMVKLFGYKAVVLRPMFSDYGGSWDFQNGVRRALVCAKQTSLDGLVVEENPPDGVGSGPAQSPPTSWQRARGFMARLRRLLRAKLALGNRARGAIDTV